MDIRLSVVNTINIECALFVAFNHHKLFPARRIFRIKAKLGIENDHPVLFNRDDHITEAINNTRSRALDSLVDLFKEIKIPQTRISQIINGNRRITADTALRLSVFFISGENRLKRIDRMEWDDCMIVSYDDKRVRICYNVKMPTISQFYGILIQMYFDDYKPSHFHAIYNKNKALIGINDFSLLHGDLPPKALSLVIEWAKLHKEELIKEWELASKKKALFDIEPLE